MQFNGCGAVAQHDLTACQSCHLPNNLHTGLHSKKHAGGIRTIRISCNRYRLNIWDVGGQKTLRSYWRNYYEQTDALIWVVDTTDLHRLEDCRNELHNLLKEERLTGATLLIFANKQDLAGSLAAVQLQKVDSLLST